MGIIRNIKSLLIIALITALIVSCKDQSETVPVKQKKKPASNQPIMKGNLPLWAKDASIYHVNLRHYTRSGSVNDFSTNLPRIKDLGIEVLAIAPFFQLSNIKSRGPLPSPYAISDHRKTDNTIGTQADFDYLISKAHAYKFKLIVDIPLSYTARDHKWTKEHPTYYKSGQPTKPLDKSDRPRIDKKGIKYLDYSKEEVQTAMTDILTYWLDKGVDGFHFIRSWEVPTDYWTELIPKLREKNPNILLVSDSAIDVPASESQMNASYDWSMYKTIGHLPVKDAARTISSLDANKQNSVSAPTKINFTSNLTQNALEGAAEDRLYQGGLMTACYVMMGDGMPLINAGQEEPTYNTLSPYTNEYIGFQKYKRVDFYREFINLKKKEPALHNYPYGARPRQVTDSDYIYGFIREQDGRRFLFIGNFSDQPRTGYITEDIAPLYNMIKAKNVRFSKGQKIELEPYKFIIGTPIDDPK